MTKSGVKTDNSDPDSGGKIDSKYAGIDTPGLSNEKSSNNFFSDNNASIYHNQTLGQEAPKINETTYADPPYTSKDKAKKLSDIREKFAKNADKPTTASADKGEKDIPTIINSVDPNQTAQVLPMMYPKLMQMVSILGIGSGNNQDNNNYIPSGIGYVLYDSFTGALCLLVRSYGFEQVITVFILALDNNVNSINPLYKDIVINSISKLIQLALYFGPLNIPVSKYDETYYGDIVPEPLVDTVPDLYVKQYYTFDSDPYPGYIQWNSPDNTKKVFTKRPAQSYVFSSSSQEIYSDSERELAKDLDVYIRNKNLTVSILNSILSKQTTNIEQNTLNNSVGNNVGKKSNLFGGMLGGQLQSLLNTFSNSQLPNSVLNKGSISQVLEQYKKDMGLNNQIFNLGKSALGGNMINFGGMSGGGGGGAGSGFPTANFNNLNNNNVSTAELATITYLINILGVKIT